ncbi:hypothetical protein [Endozoicomonas sp. 8E]|uniref:hypothetical protein n=1 Tax=Endozoicomonas sp. 8E TaxID=3035692 RepID=UPI0029392F8C|nr:hypothetical protein [Endozoicomonas sp. 8E]WOG27379.1 hypothetical protein P6910_22975 [Endozoicomonas sp. 8E]
MRKSFNLFPLLLCFLYTTAEASPPPQNDFDFLGPLNNTALVANGLELTGSIAGVSLSTLLNLGIWWGVCKTAGIVSGLSSTYDLTESDTKELEKLKTDFCLQLAPMVTITEVALAGNLSPWPLEQRWWKPLYFAGAGMAAYASVTKTREHVPVAVLTYLASEAISRTGASAISTLILRKTNVGDIKAERYAAREYLIFSAINGVMAGAVVYEAIIYKGLSPAKATLASVVSSAIAGTLSGVISMLTIDVDAQTEALAIIVTGALAGIEAGAIVGIGAGVLALGLARFGPEVTPTATIESVVRAVAGGGACAGTVVGIGAGAGAVAGLAAGAGASAEVSIGIDGGIGAGTIALGGFSALLMLGSWKITLTPNNPFIKAGVTLVPALTFALINSLSNYAIYGYPLEEGFSETGWTQWKKFYAPLDYLSTLFR